MKDFARDLANCLGDDLQAAVIGGSYGRGLGRYVEVNGGAGSGVWSFGQAPWDDVDILLILRNTSSLDADLILPIFEKYSAILGAPIDLLGIVRKERIRDIPATSAWLELLWAHVVIFGPEDILQDARSQFMLDPTETVVLSPGEAITIHARNGRDAVKSLRLLFGLSTARGYRDQQMARYSKGIQRLVDATLIAGGFYCLDHFARHDALSKLVTQDVWFRTRPELAGRLVLLHDFALSTSHGPMHDGGGVDVRVYWKEYLTIWLALLPYLSERCVSPRGARIAPVIIELISLITERFDSEPDSVWIERSRTIEF